MPVDPAQALLARRASSHAGRSGADHRPLGTERVAGVVDQPRLLCSPSDDEMPDVSIIIPARNEERWLTSTLEAALEAARQLGACAGSRAGRAEILVVDNGSSD